MCLQNDGQVFTTPSKKSVPPSARSEDVSTLPMLRCTALAASTRISPRHTALNPRPLELPRTRLTAEQHINLRKRPSLRLRQPPPTPHQPNNSGTSPEESRLSTPSPRRGVQHMRRDEIGHDAGDVVAVARQRNGLRSQACGRDFGDEDVAHGADGCVVYGCEDEQQGGDGPGDGSAGADAVGCDCAAGRASTVG